MNYTIIAEREMGARGFKLKKQISPRVKAYRRELKSSGVKFKEIFIPAGVTIPAAMLNIVPGFSTSNFHATQPLYVFAWADGQL